MSTASFRRLPFSAIVGQDKLKKAYLANIVNPRIGGFLVSGPKGTGKSTLVHSVAGILPDFQAVEACPFNCDPSQPDRLCTLCRGRGELRAALRRMRIVNLPLSCTEDRLVGSLDVERLLKSGEKVILPGILGQANGNILYVDEVNLLPDHLVDDILDASASGWNTIEREGLSIHHPARFVLAGTMNPEEGDLRPQILDRFPLCVRIETVRDPALRAEIVRINLRYEDDPVAFFAGFLEAERALAGSIVAARRLLPRVAVSDAQVLAVAESCAELKVDGQRPDIVIVKTGITLAALEGRPAVSVDDLMLAAELALCHRTRDGGLLEPPDRNEILASFSKRFDRLSAPPGKTGSTDQPGDQQTEQRGPSGQPGTAGSHLKKKVTAALARSGESEPPRDLVTLLRRLAAKALFKLGKKRPLAITSAESGGSTGESLFQDIPQAFAQLRTGFLGFLRRLARPRARAVRGSRRRRTVITYRSGRNIKPVRYQPGENVLSALLTVLRAVSHGGYDLASGRFRIGGDDLVGWEKLERQSLTLVLVVDASASTHPFINVFAEILNSLTGHFRRHQDRIGLVALHGRRAEVLNHPTHNYRVVSRNLRRMKVRGMTPLADGLEKALAVIRLERQRKPGSRNLAVLLSDCYPEPLTHRYPDIFDEPAYRQSLLAAAHFRQQRVSLLVINPSFKNADENRFLPGERLSAALARESRGRLIKIFRNEFAPGAFTRTYSPPTRREIERILYGVEGMLAGRGPERGGELPWPAGHSI